MGRNVEADMLEGINVVKSSMRDFFDDLEGRLALMGGIVDLNSVGLTLEQVRRPLMVIGDPGIGKTAGVAAVVNRINERTPEGVNFKLKKCMLGQTVVGTMTGIPVVKPDGSVVRVQVPDLPDPERDGEYGVFFLDEITTADEAQVQPALGLCDDSRNIGTYTLPEHWIVVAAGNGPNCRNFVRLDDMTISRFTVYDIAYDYKKDWREYAHHEKVNEDILAFLNFSPDTCARMESCDTDLAGKQAPNPRTWSRLSDEMRIRRAVGRPVGQSELKNFAGRIIGKVAAREFHAFCAFKDKVRFSPEDICNGTAGSSEVQMRTEELCITLQSSIRYLENFLESVEDIHAPNCVQKCRNFIDWFLTRESIDFESTVLTFLEVRGQTKLIRAVLHDTSHEFPVLDSFVDRHAQYIIENAETLGIDFNNN